MFNLDPSIDDQVARSAAVRQAALIVAEEIAAVARGTAPRESGDYAAGITAQTTKSGARVIAADYKSAWIELGVPGHGIPARFNLRRAAASLGYKFRKGR